MQNKKYLSALIIVALMLTATMAFAQKPGLTGASFLKIGVGARHIALGSAVTTVTDDPTMMFWNPAGIYSEKTNISFNHNEWLLSMAHEALAATHNFSGIGTVGIGVLYLGQGDIVADRDIAPTPETASKQADQATGSTYSFYDLAVNLSISRKFTDKLMLGASIKLIREKVDDLDATTVAGDFGVIYNTGWKSLTFGARLTNLGGDLKYYQFGAPIPLNFSIGASFAIADQEDNRLTAYVDATKPQDNQQLYFSGLEWKLLERLSLRGGYKFGLSGTTDNAGIDNTDEGASFGAGLLIPWSGATMGIDYTYTDFSVLDATHRFSFTASF